MEVKLYQLVKPFRSLVPEVAKPKRKVPFATRLLWTAGALVAYLICCQIPLYGSHTRGIDPLHWLRSILASNRGTLMELGISPVLNSGMIMQVFVGMKLISLGTSPKEKNAFDFAQKLFGMLLTVLQAMFIVYYGKMYGETGPLMNILLVLQLVAGGFFVIFLDELFQKGYGIGSPTSLFTATSTCEMVIWKALSPLKLDLGRGAEFEGALLALPHLLLTRSDKFAAIYEALFRSHLPNLAGLISTIGVLALVVYVQSFRIEMSIQSTRARGARGSYPIKLFYANTMPIMIHSTFTSNLYVLSQTLYRKFGSNLIVNLLGRWAADDGGQSAHVVGGLCYYLSPPGSLMSALSSPIRSIIYIIFMLTSCTLLAHYWLDYSGSSARDVAKMFREQKLMISGHREKSTIRELNRYIPAAAALGGFGVGALAIITDLIGAFGGGTGILLAVTTINQYSDLFAKEDIKL